MATRSRFFETDDDRASFVIRLPVHPQAKPTEIAQVGEQVGEQVAKLLNFCRTGRSKAAILAHLGLADAYLNYRRHILPCLQNGWLERTIPDKPTSRLQKYRLTAKGRALVELKDGN